MITLAPPARSAGPTIALSSNGTGSVTGMITPGRIWQSHIWKHRFPDQTPPWAICQDGGMAASEMRVYGGMTGADRRTERRAQLIEAGLDLLGAAEGDQ